MKDTPDAPGPLEPFSSATLHEVDPESRVLPTDLRPVWRGATLRGPAYTVYQGGGDNSWIHRAIYAAPAGSVLVVATGALEHGYWGELMARAALERGLAGLVIRGGVRDVDALEAVKFPVFASTVCVRGTTKDPACPGALEEPIALGDVRVATADFVVGDRDGVVVLQPGDRTALALRARAREAAEARIRDELADGRRLLDLVLGAATPGPAP